MLLFLLLLLLLLLFYSKYKQNKSLFLQALFVQLNIWILDISLPKRACGTC